MNLIPLIIFLVVMLFLVSIALRNKYKEHRERSQFPAQKDIEPLPAEPAIAPSPQSQATSYQQFTSTLLSQDCADYCLPINDILSTARRLYKDMKAAGRNDLAECVLGEARDYKCRNCGKPFSSRFMNRIWSQGERSPNMVVNWSSSAADEHAADMGSCPSCGCTEAIMTVGRPSSSTQSTPTRTTQNSATADTMLPPGEPSSIKPIIYESDTTKATVTNHAPHDATDKSLSEVATKYAEQAEKSVFRQYSPAQLKGLVILYSESITHANVDAVNAVVNSLLPLPLPVIGLVRDENRDLSNTPACIARAYKGIITLVQGELDPSCIVQQMFSVPGFTIKGWLWAYIDKSTEQSPASYSSPATGSAIRPALETDISRIAKHLARNMPALAISFGNRREMAARHRAKMHLLWRQTVPLGPEVLFLEATEPLKNHHYILLMIGSLEEMMRQQEAWQDDGVHKPEIFASLYRIQTTPEQKSQIDHSPSGPEDGEYANFPRYGFTRTLLKPGPRDPLFFNRLIKCLQEEKYRLIPLSVSTSLIDL